MAEPNYSIALDTKPPDAMKSLGSIMDIARGQQALQTGKIQQDISRTELQKSQIGLGERQGIQDLFSHPELFQDPNGQFNYDKLINEGMKRAPTTFPSMVPQIIAARTAGVNYEQAVTNLDQTKRTNVGQWFGAQEGKPLEETVAQAEALKKLDPGLAPTIDTAMGVLKLANKNQDSLNAGYRNLSLHAMQPQTQAAVTTPSGPAISTGAGGFTPNVNRFAGTVGGTIPGTGYKQGVPPTQPIIMQTSEGPQPGVVGGAATAPPPLMSGVGVGTAPQPTANAPGRPQTATLEVTEPSRHGLATAPPIGTGGVLEVVNKDRTANAEASKAARTNIGLLQNIRTYAPLAATGVGADRQALVAGIAGLFGAKEGEDIKTYSDLINKNMAMLSGGNTDLERTIKQIATPNVHMTHEAMIKAANQIVGQQKLAIARDQYLSHFKDPNQYDDERTHFNSMADPLVMQWPDMSKEEKAASVSKAAMTDKEHRDFLSNLSKATAMGLIK